ncbi:HAD family phosphatase [Micromonospora sp. NPDC005171]|uniref:HAD family hydrolase n=1 Tax=Micromonospora sp. NPDC005171 TaxID=3156866 RepID=UPI0033BDD098
MNAGHLIVDLGGVLFRFDHAHRLDRLARACGLPPGQVDALLWGSAFSADCDQGRYGSAAEVRAHIRATVGFGGTDDELDSAWCSAYQPDSAVLDVIDRHRADLPCAVFTNNGPLEEEALTRRYPDMFAGFDQVFFSHRLGHRKPDPAAFAAVATRLGATGHDIVFVDDSPANVAAARTAGWRAIPFRGPNDLVQELAGLPGVRRLARLFADYHQVHVFDDGSTTDLGDAWTDEAVANQLAVGEDALAVGTVVNVFVEVIVEVLDRSPKDDSADFDHVVEASVHVPSGQLVVMGCTDYEPDAARVPVPAGWLRVRVAGSNLDAAQRVGIDSDNDAATTEQVRIQVWPDEHGDVRLLKQWRPAEPLA